MESSGEVQETVALKPEIEETIEAGKHWVDTVYNDPARTPRIEFTVISPDDRPAKNKDQFDPRLLRELFPPERAAEAYMLGITAIHGNEPSIMTATTAAEINDILQENNLPGASIVLPSVYARTKDILLEEFPQIAGNIYLSDELGEILKKTEFNRAGYQEHMLSVARNQPAVQEELYNFLAKPFKGVSLTSEERDLEPRGRRLEINAGANVTASEPGKQETDFIFPVTLSDLITATLSDPVVGENLDPRVLETVLEYANSIESRYRTTQLPYINTLSAKPGFSTKGKILTPHIKRSRRPTPAYMKDASGLYTRESAIEPSKGIYVMGSGSDIGKEVVENLARHYHDEGYDIIAPKWFNLEFGKAAIPDVIFHPEIKAVLGRYGWGIGWMSQEAEKPFLSMPHLYFDNPEMYFNIKTMEEFGLGRRFNGRLDIIQDLIRLQPGIHELNEKIIRDLDLPPGVDGIRYTAQNILKYAMEDISSRMTEAELETGY